MKNKKKIPDFVKAELEREAQMSIQDVLNWYIRNSISGGSSWQPANAFKSEYRDGIEKLSDILRAKQQWEINASLGKNYNNVINQIHKKGTVTVYRASLYPIIPGSYVTESRKYAEEHREHVNAPEYIITKLEAYPDELGWYGDPHEFIFIPRSVERWLNIAKRRKQEYI